MTLGPNYSADPEHLFQSDADIARQQRRKEKADFQKSLTTDTTTNPNPAQPDAATLGCPINAGSKVLALTLAKIDTALATSLDDIASGAEIYVGESGFVARRLHLKDGKTIRVYKGHSGPVTCVATYFDVTANKAILLTGSWDKTIKKWCAETGTHIATYTGHSDFVKCIAVSSDGCTAWSGSSDGTIREWHLNGSTESGRVLKGHTRAVEDIKLSEDGTALYSCSSDRSVRKWDIVTGAEVMTFEGHLTSVYALTLSDGCLWTASADKTARKWDLETGKEDASYEHPDFVKCVQPVGPYVITGSRDETIRVFDAASGKCLSKIDLHFDEVSCMTLLGKLLITGSLDGTLRRWQVTDLLARGQSSAATSAIIKPAGQRPAVAPPSKKRSAPSAPVTMTAEEEAELEDLMMSD